jgi:hypothetical protein
VVRGQVAEGGDGPGAGGRDARALQGLGSGGAIEGGLGRGGGVHDQAAFLLRGARDLSCLGRAGLEQDDVRRLLLARSPAVRRRQGLGVVHRHRVPAAQLRHDGGEDGVRGRLGEQIDLHTFASGTEVMMGR